MPLRTLGWRWPKAVASLVVWRCKITLFSGIAVVFFFFPKVFPGFGTVVHLHRGLVADAHMWAYVVVDVNHSGDTAFRVRKVGEEFLVVNPLDLEDAVHTLGDGVVGGLVALGHTDADVVFGECVHISVAGVLRAAVGVVYGGAEVAASGRLDGHLQRLHGAFRLERLRQAPAYHGVGECVGDQMQVQHVALYPHVGDVGHPDVVDVLNLQSLHQIGVLAVDVVGIGRVYRLVAGQPVVLRRVEFQERVAPTGYLFPQVGGKQDVQFHSADSRTQPAVVVDEACQQFRALALGHDDLASLVVPLAMFAKQTAQELHTGVRILLAQRRHCLAPSFFNMLIPSSLSAVSISTSYPRQRIRSYSRARSNDSIFLRIASWLSVSFCRSI